MTKLRFALLGPVRAWYDDVEADLGRPQQRELLAALLAAAGRTVAVPLLVDGLWDEGERPDRPEHAVRTHVYRLRGVLAEHTSEPLLVTVGNGYALRVPAQAVDVWEFERAEARSERVRASGGTAAEARAVLDRALELWSAEPLAGLRGPQARAVRARLADVRQSLLERRLELDAEIGDRPNLAAETGALAVEFPTSQRLRAVQMLALYRSGRQAEALGVYEDTRRDLDADAGRRVPADRLPSAALRELHQRILRSDPTLHLPEQTPRSPLAAGPQRPAPLPCVVDDFTGRREEVETLTGMLTLPDTSAVVVSAVNGMAGIGKTTLAVHTVRGLPPDRFPDGHLYADLRGADREPLDPQAVVVAFLRELGTAEKDIPEDGAERIALYRSSLAERRLLLLLDNAASDGQVRPLIPGSADCSVLITSRARLTGLAGARHLRLDVLTSAEAVELLRRVVGARRVDAEPTAAATLAAACGFLPLALRIVASRLAAEPGWSLAGMARRLADERRRLDELRTEDVAVEATFALSYSKLTSEQARAFRLLSYLDVPDLGLPCAAALLGSALGDPEDTEDRVGSAEELLESLVDLNLLESRELGRYHFHDLVRAFARAAGSREDAPATVTAAFAGLLDFTLSTARNADAVAHSVEPAERTLIGVPVDSPGLAFATAQDATDWMRAEIPVQRALVARACADDGLPLAQAADLVDKLNTVLSGISHLTAVGELAGDVADVAARRGDHDAEALARYVRGNALWHANSYGPAQGELTRALALCTDDAHLRLRASAHLTLCAGARTHGRFDDAIAHGEASVRLFHTLGAATAEGTALGELAFNYARRNRLTEARAAAERGASLVCGQNGEASVSSAISLYYLARVLRLCDAADEALRHARDALSLFRTLGVSAFEAATGNLIAELHAEAGDHALTAETAETFLPLARRTSGMLEAGLLRSLGRALSRLGQAARARACLLTALELFEQRAARADVEQTRALLENLT
ncbi:BTAD domain-containing putative transcriptional regulator [Streptomyces syringium]|uniref:AfsR/SARP family transcriptional regulator n=1 Tax=Streptomyces syringium TaxID=76729 RepID=UPI003AAB921D